MRLRPMTDADWPVFTQLFAAANQDLMGQLALESEQHRQFVEMQASAKIAGYRGRFPHADYDLIELDDTVIGNLFVARDDVEIRLIDIALLDEHQGAGIGGRLVRGLQADAAASALPVTLSVARSNRRARVLYERLGFLPDPDLSDDVYLAMIWRT